jgi:hypothetical protein
MKIVYYCRLNKNKYIKAKSWIKNQKHNTNISSNNPSKRRSKIATISKEST